MRFASAVAFIVFVTANAFGQFTAGNLVVARVGDGSASLSNAAAAAFLDEYTTGGTFVQTITLPTSGTNKITFQGSATSEGGMSRSTDGRYLVFAGYDATPTTATPASSTASSVNRVIARVDALASVDLSTKLTDAFNGSNVRSAASTDGTNLWVSGNGGSGQGASAGTRYTTFGSTTTTGLHSSQTNIRWVKIFNNQLYATTASTSIFGVVTVGTGTPTTTGQTVTELAGMPTSGTHSPYGFSISPDGNTMYVADDGAVGSGGGIQKWTLGVGTWSLVYTLLNNGSTTTGARALVVDWSGTNPVIYATTSLSPTTLIKVTDTGSSSTATTLATAATNTAFRGVAFAPYATETFTDGTSYPAPNGTPNTNDNPIGRFQLAGNINGGSLASVTVTLTGTYSGITQLKLYASSSASFSVGSATLLASTSAIGSTATLTVSGGHPIPSSGEYYFLAADLNSSAAGRVLVSLADQTALTFTNAALYTTFSNNTLSTTDIALPVTATAMSAKVNAGKVLVNFSTATEINLAGFNVLRATTDQGPFEFISGYESNKSLTAKGSVTTGASYSFVDPKVNAGHTYYYKVEAVDKSGATEQLGGIIAVDVTVPKDYAVYQNYPNPFNPSTTIAYDLKEASQIRLEVYNLLGMRVRSMSFEKEAGTFETTLNFTGMSSGIYYYRMVITGKSGSGFVSTKKMLMVK